MKTFLSTGGSLVAAGTYWGFAEGELVRLKREGALPGTSDSRFLRMPVALLLLLSPLVGLMFVMFLPVAGLFLTAYLPIRALVARIRGTAPVTRPPLQVDRQES